MSDLGLRNTILEALEFQPDINAANIGVAVDNGVVTLSGHVSSFAQKVSAERVVKGVKGVRAVAEEIQVRLDKGAGTADDVIATCSDRRMFMRRTLLAGTGSRPTADQGAGLRRLSYRLAPV